MGMSKWLSIDTVQTPSGTKVLQQKVKTGGNNGFGFKPHYTGEHRLVDLSELTGIDQLNDDVEVVE